MTSILDHAWGISLAIDRIWAQVSGFIEPERRLLVVLQAAIDDSREGNIIVLAGHVASAESWAKFTKLWEELLPYSGLKDKNGNYYFKMSEMALSSDGIERSQAFFRIIEKHILLSISCRVDIDVLARARDRVVVPSRSVKWAWLENPYMFATRVLLDGFHQDKAGGLQNYIPIDSNVDFIFDDQTEKKPILAAWDEYLANRDEKTRSYYGTAPRFEDDMKFLPLQAADFWAWWVRKWEEKPKFSLDFGQWKPKRFPYPVMRIVAEEDEIVNFLVSIMRQMIGHGATIIDRKTGNPI